MVRGLDYYMRTTFEIVHGSLGAQNSVLGGGRYDGLAESLGSRVHSPGIGFSIGEDRLVMSVEQAAPTKEDPLVIVTFTGGETTRRAAANAAAELRAEGIRVELAEGKLKKVFEVANKLNARVALICGDNETAAGDISMKDMESQVQVQFRRELLVGKGERMPEQVPLDFLGDLRRTHTCGQLRASDVGKTALLMGWVHRRRDLGGVFFVHLRDRDGVTQIVFHADAGAELHAKAEMLGSEYVIAVEGTVAKRTPETINPTLETGEVELVATKLWILNESRTPPFPMEETVDVKEDARLKYRYVDLRRPHMQRNIMLRSKISFAVREFLYSQGFLEIETPFMTRSTPGRRARLSGPQPRAARLVLRAAAIAADLQAASDGERL